MVNDCSILYRVFYITSVRLDTFDQWLSVCPLLSLYYRMCHRLSHTGRLGGCWRLTSLQHPRSYQDEYRLVTGHTHDDLYYSTAPLGDQATSIMTRYPMQQHYPDIVQNSPCLILSMLSSRLGSDTHPFFYKSLV